MSWIVAIFSPLRVTCGPPTQQMIHSLGNFKILPQHTNTKVKTIHFSKLILSLKIIEFLISSTCE
jgi:hypothetical protein